MNANSPVFSVVVQFLVDQRQRVIHLLLRRKASDERRAPWWRLSFTAGYLTVSPALLPDRLDPGHHVLLVLRLQQVLAQVLRGQPQDVLASGVPVGDVHQTPSDADGGAVLQPAARPDCLQHSLPLVFVEEERVGPKDREDTLPGSQAPAGFLPRG